jgi:CheY-like chemotaxis protein
MLETNFGAQVIRAYEAQDALELLRTDSFDLVLVNRKLDSDYSDGLPIIEAIKADPNLAHLPCMLITNYAEHQEAAVQAGAVTGFGKKEIHLAATQAKLAPFLKPEAQAKA